MNWKERWQEYTAERATITNEELDEYTSGEWGNWCTAWQNYVANGGQRPPRRPPI